MLYGASWELWFCVGFFDCNQRCTLLCPLLTFGTFFFSFLYLFYIKKYYILFSFDHDENSLTNRIYSFKGLWERNNHNILLSICSNFQWTSFLLILCKSTSIKCFFLPSRNLKLKKLSIFINHSWYV